MPRTCALVKTVTFLLLIFVADAYAKITKGPFLLRLEENRAALMWESDTPGGGRISYGKDKELEKHIDTIPQQVVKNIAFVHKLWLRDLDPGWLYYYRVADTTTKSKTYSFRTQPTDTNEVRFIVYGDSRSNPYIHRKLVKLMINKKVDFIVNAGDLVKRGGKYKQWGPQFFEPLKGLAESVPVYTVKGDHDKDKRNYFEKLLIPPGQTANFSFNYGPIHYYCGDNVTATETKLLDLIKADMSGSTKTWKFVSYHVPSINFGGHRSAWGYPDALAVLSAAGVDFVAAGHSHLYERFRPIAPPNGVNGSFVTHITSGGGGARLYNIEPTIYHASVKKTHHFCLFSIKADKLTMDTFDIDGKIIDHLTITKTDGRLNQEYLQTAIPMELIQLPSILNSVMIQPMPVVPRKNQQFTISYKFSVPPLPEPAEITFKLRCRRSDYQLGEPKTVIIPEDGGTVSVELTITPLIEVKVPTDKITKAKPLVPALWIDCHYQIGQVQDDISVRVFAEPKN